MKRRHPKDRLQRPDHCVLHIGKTAGTALMSVLKQHLRRVPDAPIAAFHHSMTLPRLRERYPDAKVVFFVRDPIERFVSGFNSRLRQGLPRHHHAWTPAEQAAFERFATANALAEALSANSVEELTAAREAMLSIGHVRQSLADFLDSPAFLQREGRCIAFIGEQSAFDSDLAVLRRLLDIDPDILAPADDVGSHRMPAGMNRFLSEQALANLRDWYAADYPILEWCREKRRTLLAEMPAKPTE